MVACTVADSKSICNVLRRTHIYIQSINVNGCVVDVGQLYRLKEGTDMMWEMGL